MLGAMLNRLRGYRRVFLPLEAAILAEVRSSLPEQVHPAFDDRLARINMIQPILGGQEVNLYERHKGVILFPASSRILPTDDSIPIATVELSSSDPMSRLKARLYCGRGVLTSLEFDRPSEHAELETVTAMKVRVTPKLPWN